MTKYKLSKLNKITIVIISAFSLMFGFSSTFVSALSPSSFLTGFKVSTFAESSISVKSLPQVSTDSSETKIVLNIFFAILGAIALLVITLAGFRYIVSKG
jgi:hypothetical protein